MLIILKIIIEVTYRKFSRVPCEEACEERWLTSFHDNIYWSFMG